MTIESRVSSGNVLMDLRIVILRTIALVWENDKESVVKLINNRAEKHRNSPFYIKHSNEIKYLTGALGLSETTLRSLLIDLSPELLKIFFMLLFEYTIPFNNFGVKFISGSAKWNLYGDDEWSKPDGETISLVLPNREESWDSYQRAYYLMEFYHFFPSFFGSKNKESTLTPAAQETNPGIDFSGNDYHLGVAEDNFLGFGALINKVIAVAWNNKNFKEHIDYDEFKKENQPDEIYYSRIAAIFKEHYDFEIPWAFNIKLQFARTAAEKPADPRAPFWTGSGKNWTWYAPKGIQLIRNTVSLEIPAAPNSDEENVSLALARYNLIGPKYPFTCS